MPVAEERKIGQEIAQEARRRLPLITDYEISTFIGDIGKRIVKTLGAQPFDYEFFVVKDDSLNAFAVPGGKVFVHAGLIARASNVDEIAGVMAHEVAHAHAHHHNHDHAHNHDHHSHDGHDHDHHRHDSAPTGPDSVQRREVVLESRILARNDEQAERNRQWLTDHGVIAINLKAAQLIDYDPPVDILGSADEIFETIEPVEQNLE